MSTARPEPAPLATPVVSALGVAILVLYGVSSGPRAYGMMSDESYYLACAERLAWGYVDHPPLSIGVLALVESVLGDSLLALRLVPAVLACLNVWLVALLTRELGGGRTAQSLAALATATAPVFLALVGFYSMNAFEPPLWTGAALLLAHIAKREDGAAALWLGLGLLLGVGLLTKLSTLWLGLGIGAGLVLSGQRRWLGTPWPWACALLALLVFAPHLWWQWQHDWPTLEFMRNAREQKMLVRSPAEMLSGLFVSWSASVLLWLPGLAYLLLDRRLAPHRWLGWIWLSVFALLFASGTARPNYGAPAFALLFAGGGVALERFARSWLRTAATLLLVAWMLVGGLVALPLAVPLLPPADLVRYAGAIGIQPPQDEKEPSGPLPLHFALRFGWEELVDAVARAAATLAPGERTRAVVLAGSFGEAGALEASPRDLPPVVSGHNSWWLWGPGETDLEVAIVVSEDPAEAERWYREVVTVAEVDCQWCRPALARTRVAVARGLRVSVEEFWQAQKHFE